MKTVFRAALLVVAIAGVACSRDSIPEGAARLTSTGRVLVTEPGGRPRSMEAGTVKAGSTVTVVEGWARLAVAGGTTYELRPSATFVVGRTPELTTGQLLVEAPTRRVTVASAGSAVVVDGVARITRSLGLDAAVYRGQAVLQSAGREFPVPALRQAAIPALGIVPTAATPLRVDPDDAWDRRLLAEAIALADELEARSLAFGPNVRPELPRDGSFFKDLLPGLGQEPAFSDTLLVPGRPAGETLVGASIVTASAKGAFGDRWQAVFGFRSEGATWGLVAMDQGVGAPAALTTVDAAVGRTRVRFAAPGPAAGGPSSPSPAGAGAAPVPGGPAAPAPPTPAPGIPPVTTPTTQPGTPAPSTPTTLPAVTVPPVTVPPAAKAPTSVPTTAPASSLVQPVVDTINGLLGRTTASVRRARLPGSAIPVGRR